MHVRPARAARLLRLLQGLRGGAPDAPGLPAPPGAPDAPHTPGGVDRALRMYLGRAEHVVWSTRQHPFAVLTSFVEALSLLAPLMLVAWGAAGISLLRDNAVGQTIVMVAFLAMVLVVARLAWSVLGWEFARLLVTNEKVVLAHGILHRRIASTPLVKVSELTVSQSVFGRMFGYGSLVVDAPGGGEMPLHGLTFIPQPARLYRLISDMARDERAIEGGGVGRTAHIDWRRQYDRRAGTLSGDDDAPTLDLRA